MSNAYDYDLYVIGAGSGGVRASRISAGFGARVAVAEDRPLGGTCVNVGCVPKKLFVYSSHTAEDIEAAAGYGWTVEGAKFHWPTLIANKNKEIERLNGIYRKLLDNAGVDLHEARATLVDAHTVDVGGRQVTAETILIATGGWPYLPDIPGIENAITSNEAFFLDDLPKRVAVIGGGYIAVEFAGIFNGMGSKVTQLYRGEQILRGFDADVRHTLAEEIRKKGIDLRCHVNVMRIDKTDTGLTLHLTDDSTLEVDTVMFATGRVPNTKGLNLHDIGVATDEKGAILVDEFSKTSVDNIYAIGDVTDRIALTPVAIMEGMAFARTLYGGMPTAVDHANVPSAVFSQPPVGSVGLTEEEARAEHGDVHIYRSTFTPMKHTMTGRGEKTMMKLIVEPKSDRVLGAHMVGPDAGEIIQGIGIAVKMGATKAQFDATIGIHPTAAEEFVTMRDRVEPLAEAAE